VGKIQEHNLTLAVAAMDAAGALPDLVTIQRGAAAASIPGRFQRIQHAGRTILLDGAHNPDALAVLRQALEAEYGAKRCILVTNMLQGHEPEQFFVQLKDQVSTVHVVPISFHRTTPVPDMVGHLQKTFPNVVGHNSIEEGLEAAITESQPEDIILVTGSFYLVGEVIRALHAAS
jgi:dihydrofolate synthase/folylpolyglutamate synthase